MSCRVQSGPESGLAAEYEGKSEAEDLDVEVGGVGEGALEPRWYVVMTVLCRFRLYHDVVRLRARKQKLYVRTIFFQYCR